jgi:REP element-mobilizing transposase RayT
MPALNSVKIYEPDSYYHVYNRGAGKQPIFIDRFDKTYFIGLLDRYLNPKNIGVNTSGEPYPKYLNMELLAYCLMGNHFHLLTYINDDVEEISKLLKSLLTSYTMYFNLKYRRSGALFQGVYKATKITNDAYLVHISRYIHLNPRTYRTYKFSSLGAYLGLGCPAWLKPKRIVDLFEGNDYLAFVDDWADYQESLSQIGSELADRK